MDTTFGIEFVNENYRTNKISRSFLSSRKIHIFWPNIHCTKYIEDGNGGRKEAKTHDKIFLTDLSEFFLSRTPKFGSNSQLSSLIIFLYCGWVENFFIQLRCHWRVTLTFFFFKVLYASRGVSSFIGHGFSYNPPRPNPIVPRESQDWPNSIMVIEPPQARLCV